MEDRTRDAGGVDCFIDTNLLLHFRTFDEVNWLEVVDASHVTVWLAPVVIKEIGKFKDDGQYEWRRQRARTVIRKLDGYFPQDDANQPAQLRPQVLLRTIAHEPIVRWEALGLDPYNADDRLIAAVLVFKDAHPGADARIVSDDMNLRQKAKAHGLGVVRPEGKIDRLEPSSPLIAENKRLKQQLEEAQRRIPQLEVGFWEHKEIVGNAERGYRAAGSGSVHSVETLAAAVDQRKAEIAELYKQGLDVASEAQLRQFLHTSQRHVAEYEGILKMLRAKESGPWCTLSFAVCNNGTVAANGVEMEFILPEGSFVIDTAKEDDELHTELWIPDSPIPPWRPQKRPFPLLITPSPVMQSPRRPVGPILGPDSQRYIVHYNCPDRLKAGLIFSGRSVVVYFPPEVNTGGLAIKAIVTADELPAPDERDLHLVWKREATEEA